MNGSAKPNFIGYPEQKLKQLFADWEVEPYRIHQIFNWVYHRGARSFDGMTNLSKSLRHKLKEHFILTLPDIASKTKSKDGSIKYLFELSDGHAVESVWMPEDDRKTLCISTQVGCRLACTFCLTGTMGLKRNLTSSEIVGQLMGVNDDLPEENHVTNIVFMGMGEPLDNFEETSEALRLMISPEAMRVSTRKITVSTAGQVDRIRQFQEEHLPVNLAVSLNATEDTTRDQIMPINRKYPIATLLDCLRAYPLKPTRRITFEYVLLKGINDSDQDAHRLVKLLRNIPSKINLIVFNSFPGTGYGPPEEQRVQAFQKILIDHHYSAFVRKNRGTDILGACGQLAANSGKSSMAAVH